MSFKVPSSTPPSTPGSRRASRYGPSTTPAGPPPSMSYIPSSTPAGPPPPKLFAAPELQPTSFGTSSFPHNLGSSPPKANNMFFGVGSGQFGVPTSARPNTPGRSFRAPGSSPSPLPGDEESEEEDEAEEQDFEDEEEDEDMEDDEDDEDDEEEDDEMNDEDEDASGEEDDEFHERPLNKLASKRALSSRSRGIDSVDRPLRSAIVRPTAKQAQYDLLKLAKGLTAGGGQNSLPEPDEMILETERLMGKLHESVLSDAVAERDEVVDEVVEELLAVWRACAPPSKMSGSFAGRLGGSSSLSNANRLASLQLQIRYPGHAAISQPVGPFSMTLSRREARRARSIPKALLDWLETYHGNSAEIALVLREQHGYSAHSRFWDAIHYSVLRGNFTATLKLLKGARFENAESAATDGFEEYGYSGVQLESINTAVAKAIKIIESCPGITSDDWDMKNQEWAYFRRQVEGELRELQEFAEGNSRSRNAAYQPFQSSNFGQSAPRSRLSEASRKAESAVPWTVYQSLSKLYRQLLGGEEEVLSTAIDWVEAVLGLAIWWDGEDYDVAQGSMSASRRSLGRSSRPRTVDITPARAYSQRLSAALATVLESDEGFSVNTTDPTEVGLACIFDDNVEGFLRILRNWSHTIASGDAEVASAGGWFGRTDGILDQFDQSDLMILSYTEQQRPGLTKDDLLVSYAKLLQGKEAFANIDRTSKREGWELAVQVLQRLENETVANEQLEKLLDDLPLNSLDRVNKIVALLNQLDLTQHALRISSKYADHLSQNTQNYGDTLLYYARAHNSAKIKEVLQILVSHCVVKSMSFPPLAEVDDQLGALITSPKETLTEVARTDPEAAQILAQYFSGYATIRKFYDLRDEEILAEEGQKPAHRPKARKRLAADALVVVIQSAASSIRGGLYDPEVETVVQVDVLLSLLGEALVFVNQSKRTLKLPQLYALLSAVEDLETAPSLISAQCEECFRSTLAAAHGESLPSPGALLQKSTSNLTTASSQFSIIGSTELPGSVEDQSTESSAVLIRGGKMDEAKRAWDWRKGFAKDAEGGDVIRILRLGLAHEVGRAWTEGEA